MVGADERRCPRSFAQMNRDAVSGKGLYARALENHARTSNEERMGFTQRARSSASESRELRKNRSQASRDLPRMHPTFVFKQPPRRRNTQLSFSTPGLSKMTHPPARSLRRVV